MSEMNQAFLRAYLKNRASQSSTTPPTPASADTQTHQNPSPSRPPATAARRPPVPPTQPSQTLPTGMNLRFDPSHAEPKSVAPPKPKAAPLPPTAIARAQPAQPAPADVSPRQGVWSPLGPERGMKAMERTSLPAVVRNGITPVTSEASRYRKQTVEVRTEPTAEPVAAAKSPVQNAPVQNRTAVGTSYDQVVFVDGLEGHAAAHRQSTSKPTDRTLAEIAEPIAFGTGVPASLPPARRTQAPSLSPVEAVQTAKAVQAIPVRLPQVPQQSLPTQESVNAPARPGRPSIATPLEGQRSTVPVPSAPKQAPRTPPIDGPSSRRLDTSHSQTPVQQKTVQQTPVQLETAAPEPPKIKTAAQLNPAIPLPIAFSPSWEVDQFFWPEVVKQIESTHADAFHQIGKHLSLANRDGLKVMAITSGERGVGRSTVAMHMARCAANAGLRVALIDGDTFCPSLVDQLRLDMQQGWQDCLFENIPLPEIAVHSIADGITFFPLTSVVSQQQLHANLHRMAKLVRRVSNAFDMVFIDGNRLNLEQRDLVGVAQETVIDAAIVVVDTELSIKEKVDSAVSILQGMGISSIGLVENFQS